MLLIVTVSRHAIELDRDMDRVMTAIVVVLASTGMVVLINLYPPTAGLKQ